MSPGVQAPALRFPGRESWCWECQGWLHSIPSLRCQWYMTWYGPWKEPRSSLNHLRAWNRNTCEILSLPPNAPARWRERGWGVLGRALKRLKELWPLIVLCSRAPSSFCSCIRLMHKQQFVVKLLRLGVCWSQLQVLFYYVSTCMMLGESVLPSPGYELEELTTTLWRCFWRLNEIKVSSA